VDTEDQSDDMGNIFFL